ELRRKSKISGMNGLANRCGEGGFSLGWNPDASSNGNVSGPTPSVGQNDEGTGSVHNEDYAFCLCFFIPLNFLEYGYLENNMSYANNLPLISQELRRKSKISGMNNGLANRCGEGGFSLGWSIHWAP
ncbi:hypothetical protein Tco_1446287, partial [Tanacetum coccineum]